MNECLHLEAISLIPYQNPLMNLQESIQVEDIYVSNFDFKNSSLEFITAFNKTGNTSIINSDYRARYFLENDCFDNVYFSVSSSFEREFETFKFLYGVAAKDVKINVSLNVPNGDAALAHESYSKWKECSFINRVMSAPIVTGDAALRCIDSGCDDLVIGFNNDYANLTGIKIPILNSLKETKDLILKVDSTLLDSITLIANMNDADYIDFSKALAFGANKIMLLNQLEILTETKGWDMPNIWQAIKFFSRNKVKIISNKIETNSIVTCDQLVNLLNRKLRETIYCLGLDSTKDFSDTEIDYIKLM